MPFFTNTMPSFTKDLSKIQQLERDKTFAIIINCQSASFPAH